jgi:hypothetical protein
LQQLPIGQHLPLRGTRGSRADERLTKNAFAGATIDASPTTGVAIALALSAGDARASRGNDSRLWRAGIRIKALGFHAHATALAA